MKLLRISRDMAPDVVRLDLQRLDQTAEGHS